MDTPVDVRSLLGECRAEINVSYGPGEFPDGCEHAEVDGLSLLITNLQLRSRCRVQDVVQWRNRGVARTPQREVVEIYDTALISVVSWAMKSVIESLSMREHAALEEEIGEAESNRESSLHDRLTGRALYRIMGD